MFTAFYYFLKDHGLNVSISEWMTMLEGLKLGLHDFSLMGFYRLCRATLIKSESDFDTFDLCFAAFFYDIAAAPREVPPELLDWLNGGDYLSLQENPFLRELFSEDIDMDEIMRRFEERLKEQDSEHNGGSKWIGRDGYSPFGNHGKRLGGIRVGGNSSNRSAFQVIGERRYQDFRRDTVLDIRQFQMAFRKLRQQSAQAAGEKTELDVDATVRETGDNAGLLKIEYKKPRRNQIKVLLLMDSGGSMYWYASLCNMLFQAAVKSNTFKDLQIYYFHNCIYDEVYGDPSMTGRGISTEWLFANLDSQYRVIIVGDAMMAPEELLYPLYHWSTRTYNQFSGQERLNQLKQKYPHIIWLNPQPREELRPYWVQTYDMLSQQFPMYDLTVEGLEQGIHSLLSKR